MREVRNGLLYTESHEWIQKMGDGTVVIGITDYAQNEAGDVVYVDIPAEGTELAAGDEYGALESVKTVEPLYSPVSGKVTRSNNMLENSPDMINSSPYDDGWLMIIKLSEPGELDGMMDASSYKAFTG
jgi:glycine cleavage system H protein